MKDALFDELLESVREGGAILRGETEASRSFEFPENDGVPDIGAIRERRARDGTAPKGHAGDEPEEG